MTDRQPKHLPINVVMCNENGISSFTEQKIMIALAVSGLGATRPAFYAEYLQWYPPTPYAQKVITPFKNLRNMQTPPPTIDYTPPRAVVSSGLCKKKSPHYGGVVITNWDIMTSCSIWVGLRSSVGIFHFRCTAYPTHRCRLSWPPVCLPQSRPASHHAYLSCHCIRQRCV